MKRVSKVIFEPLHIFMLMCIIVTVAICSLTVVWFRMQISNTASDVRALGTEFAEVERNTRMFNSRIARMHQPLVLKNMLGHDFVPNQVQQELHYFESKNEENQYVFRRSASNVFVANSSR